MLVAALAGYGLASSTAFAIDRVEVVGGALSPAAEVRAAAGVGEGANPFTLDTAAVASRVAALPTVASAGVSVDLLSGVTIRILERTPILAWAVGDRRLLVDAGGRIFATLPADPPDAAVAAELAGVPAIVDERPSADALAVGATLDPIEFEVARRLGSLRPADVSSGASALGVAITASDGFVVRPTPPGWTAVFGLYTPTLRPPTMIPGQVRLLSSLLAGREASVGRVLLASETDGTYEPRASAGAGADGGSNPPDTPSASAP
jgi:hypothetical protein